MLADRILTSLITFNGNVFEHFLNESSDSLEESTIESYIPHGSTALFDAIGYTILKLEQSESDDETSFLIMVITDGEENASTHFTAASLKEKLETLKADKRWTITVMGCDKNYLDKLGDELNIPKGNMATFDKSNLKGGNVRNKAMSKYFTASNTINPGMHLNDANLRFYSSNDKILDADTMDVQEKARSWNSIKEDVFSKFTVVTW